MGHISRTTRRAGYRNPALTLTVNNPRTVAEDIQESWAAARQHKSFTHQEYPVKFKGANTESYRASERAMVPVLA